MALASILRKSANSLAPLAIRLTRVQRNYHFFIATALNHGFQCQNPAVNRFYYPNTLRFSTASYFKRVNAADDSLLRLLESKIQRNQVEGAASGFPFKMEDDDGKITLAREYNDELIEIDIEWDDLKDEDSSFPFVVSVTKGDDDDDDGLGLEFECTAMAEKIVLDDLTVKDYKDPEFYLDEKLKEGFLRYLELRGIEASTSNSLHKYMMSYKNNRDDFNYIRYLKTLKKFVET